MRQPFKEVPGNRMYEELKDHITDKDSSFK